MAQPNNFFNFLPFKTPSASAAPSAPKRATTGSNTKRFFGELQAVAGKAPPPPPAAPPARKEAPKDEEEEDDIVEVAVVINNKDDQDHVDYTYSDKLFATSKYNNTLLHGQWECLLERVAKEEPGDSFQLSGDTVAGMLYLCKGLNANFQARFRALELFNSYLQKFAKRHEEFLDNCSDKERQEFRARYENQVLLRMCTCILIASKLHSDTQLRALTTETVRDYLAKEKLKFSRGNIARSEMRVLEILDFRCLWVTPLELVEQLLSILKLPLESMKRAHYFCILLLEYCYSDLENIRKRFTASIKKSRRFTVSSGVITLPLQSAAIVAAALFIVSTETKTELHKMVANAAKLNEEDVHVLAILLLDLLNSA